MSRRYCRGCRYDVEGYLHEKCLKCKRLRRKDNFDHKTPGEKAELCRDCVSTTDNVFCDKGQRQWSNKRKCKHRKIKE